MQFLLGQSLEFAYGGEAVLHVVDVRIAPGRATALVGPSGAGKTTLIWILAGLLKPSGGRVLLAEQTGQGEPQACRPSQDMPVGMVFQQPALWDHLSAEKHLELVLAGKALSRSERRRRIDRTLAQMRLLGLRKRRPAQLSGGERQRLAIARALAVEPQWLFLDEPLAHLDGAIRAELFELLRAALGQAARPPAAGGEQGHADDGSRADRPRAGVLLATHDAAEALRLADEVVILLGGRVAQAGPARQVYRNPVSLEAARVLGPACEVVGEARGGALTAGGKIILEGLAASAEGLVRIILRPEDVEFRPDPGGPAVVVRCEFMAASYLLSARAAGTGVLALHGQAVAPGTPGRLRLHGPGQ